MDEPGSTIQHVLLLRRADPDTNAARFYALMIERDLFGRVVLVRSHLVMSSLCPTSYFA